MAKNIINDFDPQFYLRCKIFQDIQAIVESLQWQYWPKIEQFMALLPQPIYLASGQKLSMHHQYEDLPFPEMGYEERIFKTGIISTREQNWHDFFNVFAWLFFPQTKVLLNHLHIQELQIQATKKRTPARDAITHLDESGVIIASANPQLVDDLKEHRWQQVFWQQRELWWQQIGAFVFGHGLYEKALNPFIGFTAKAYCIEVDKDFFALEKTQQYQHLDELLAKDIAQSKGLSDSRKLSPLPVLGVPTWWDDNQNQEFYFNQGYFRAKREK